MTVKSILHVGQWDYEDHLAVTLKNCGSGIAIVKKMSVSHSTTDEVLDHLYAWLPQTLVSNVNYSKYWTPVSEFVVQAGEVIDLIRIPIDSKLPARVAVRKSLRRQIGT